MDPLIDLPIHPYCFILTGKVKSAILHGTTPFSLTIGVS